MGVFDFFKKKQNKSIDMKTDTFVEKMNPIVEYDVSNIINRIYGLQLDLDKRASVLFSQLAADPKVSPYFDLSKEQKHWDSYDFEDSVLFSTFPDDEIKDDDTYNYFADAYVPKIEQILIDVNFVESLYDQIDGFKYFKVALFNVFNNANNLSPEEYFQQVLSRASDYNMEIISDNDSLPDLCISFDPFNRINRSEKLLSFDAIHLSYNENFKSDGYMYEVDYLSAWSAYEGGSSFADYKIFGNFDAFNSYVNQYCSSRDYVLFHRAAIKEIRDFLKKEYNVPPSYFEAYFIDTSSLIDYSPKSFKYGNTNIYIPKSKVVIAGERLFVENWLYYKLRDQLDSLSRQPSLDVQITSAKSRAKTNNDPVYKTPTKDNHLSK